MSEKVYAFGYTSGGKEWHMLPEEACRSLEEAQKVFPDSGVTGTWEHPFSNVWVMKRDDGLWPRPIILEIGIRDGKSSGGA